MKILTDVGFKNIEKRPLAGPAEIVIGYKKYETEIPVNTWKQRVHGILVDQFIRYQGQTQVS